MSTEQEQKASFEKKLRTTLFSYYRSTVNIGDSTFKAIQQERNKIEKNMKADLESSRSSLTSERYEEEKRLFDDEGFGDVYTFVKDVFLSLSKDPYLMMVLIDKYQHS